MQDINGKIVLSSGTCDASAESFVLYSDLSTKDKKRVDKTKKTNPIPGDAMTYAQLCKHPNRDKIVADLYAKSNKVRNRSCIFYIYSMGFGITWAQLKILAPYARANLK